VTSDASFPGGPSPEGFARPSVAVDVALVTVVDDHLAVLLVRRDQPPHRGRWQLPGGFVGSDESLDAAAARVLSDKAGVNDVYTEQLYTFGKVGRDPRTRVISVAYYALVPAGRLGTAGPGTTLARIEAPGDGGPVLMAGRKRLQTAFDHAEIVGLVVKRLRGKLAYTPVGYELLPDEFTLLDLQRIHETILGVTVNKDSFRRRMLASGELASTGHRQAGVDHRPAALYRHRDSAE
jgi:ADP-ribose pyrophosphatase YjhB (NUDIX family)